MTQHSWNIGKSIVGILTLVMLAGCGKTTNTDIVPGQTSSPAGTYQVEYIPGMTETVGKSTFQLRVINRSNSAIASGLTGTPGISAIPFMVSLTMNHSAPADVVTESSTPGTYDCTAYYLMTGDWELQVNIGTETVTFHPVVGGGMGMTPKLKGQSDDIITKSTGTETRTYYLFKDDMTATDSASLFISAQGNNKMTFSSVFSGATLTNEANTPRTISTVVVEATTDPANVSSWATGTNTGGGHWTVPITPALASMATGTVYVRLFVDGVQKSTNGMVVSSPTSTNGYVTIVVTQGM